MSNVRVGLTKRNKWAKDNAWAYFGAERGIFLENLDFSKYFFFTGEAMSRGQWPDIFEAVSAFFTTQKYTNSQIPQIQNEITGRQEQ